MVETSGLTRHTMSAGILLLLSAGLLLYQLTSLALGPAASRQIDLSLSLPSSVATDLSEPVGTSANLVLGTRVSVAPAQKPARTSWRPPPPPAATARPALTPAVTVAAIPLPTREAGKHHEPD
jgi:hypothetical protein